MLIVKCIFNINFYFRIYYSNHSISLHNLLFLKKLSNIPCRFIFYPYICIRLNS